MTTKRSVTRSELRTLGVPTQLVDEVLGIGALGLDRPAPTDVLVANTLAKCRETLEHMRQAAEQVPGISLQPAVTPGVASRLAWGQFLGALQASVLDEALPFAASHPEESAIVLVDNHAVVDPEQWDADPALTLLRGAYRTADEALTLANAKPVCRVVVLKDNLDAYDDHDLAVIRRAIAKPMTKCTYVVSNEHARMLQGRSCAVIGREIVFEMSQGPHSGTVMVAEPLGIRDPARASNVRELVSNLSGSVIAVYHRGRLDPKLEWALRSNRNDRLREVLAEVIR